LSPLPPPHTIPQNSGKTMVLPVLPPVAALNFPVIIFEHRTQWTILPDFISQKKNYTEAAEGPKDWGLEKQ